MIEPVELKMPNVPLGHVWIVRFVMSWQTPVAGSGLIVEFLHVRHLPISLQVKQVSEHSKHTVPFLKVPAGQF